MNDLEAKIRDLGAKIYAEMVQLQQDPAVGVVGQDPRAVRLEELSIASKWNSHALAMCSKPGAA